MFRSSHQRCSVTKGVLRNFTKFTGKPMCTSLFFNKVAVLRPETLLKRDSGTDVFLRSATLFKKRLWHRGFPVNLAKFQRTPPVAASVCCRRRVPPVKIEKLKAFIKYYDIAILFTKTKNINLVTLNT